jgi:hypothetical protein
MKITGDFYKVETGIGIAQGGAKPEPEERPVDRILTTEMDVGVTTLEAGLPGRKPIKRTLQGELAVRGTVAEYTQEATMKKCMYCKHFNRSRWLRTLTRMKNDPGGALGDQLNGIRGGLLMTQNASLATKHEDEDGSLDVEQTLVSLGICDAYSAPVNPSKPGDEDPWLLLHGMSSCPAAIDGRPVERAFRWKDAESKKIALEQREKMLLIAKSASKK